jgi:hypothetical protein
MKVFPSFAAAHALAMATHFTLASELALKKSGQVSTQAPVTVSFLAQSAAATHYFPS